MPTYDYIYGSRIIVQCKEQINIHFWKGDSVYSRYVQIINKNDDFFNYWCKPRHAVKCIVRDSPEEELDVEIKRYVGTEIDDELMERNRVISWAKEEGTKSVVRRGGRGHRGQNLSLQIAFCAKDQGPDFKLPEYSSTR